MKILESKLLSFHSPKLLALLGIGFWFFLAFPFGNRNEGYFWYSLMEKSSFFSAIFTDTHYGVNYRPLSQMILWLLYQITGNSIPFQIFNITILLLAFYYIIDKSNIIEELSIFYFLVGFVFITSFYYMFNIHGNNMCLLLLYIAFLIRRRETVIDKWKSSFIVTLILAFTHPFIIPMFLLFFWGTIVEKKFFQIKQLVFFALSSAVLIILMKTLFPGTGSSLIILDNILGSMRNVEVNMLTKLVLLFFSIIASFTENKFVTRALQILIVLFIPVAIIFKVPVFVLFVVIGAIKLLMTKQWALMGLLVAGILYPLVVVWGAPSKCIILLFISPFIICLNNPLLRTINFPKYQRFTLPIATILFIVVILTRQGVNIPYFTPSVKPLITEGEKTFHLEKFSKEMFNENKRIVFLQSTRPKNRQVLRDQGVELKRSNLPPTSQMYFDFFQSSKYKTDQLDTFPKVYISFGSRMDSDSLQLTKVIKGNWSEIFVYQKPISSEPMQ